MSTTAKQLPSGKWRCRAYYVDDAGIKRSASFTADKKNEAEYLARAYILGRHHKKNSGTITVGEAIDIFIDNRNSILSPSTITGYRRMRNFAFTQIIDLRLALLTTEKVQAYVNNYAKDHSPKSVRNALALLSAAISSKVEHINFPKILLPATKRSKIVIPTTKDLDIIIHATIGTNLHLPVLFGALLGMRRSEVAAITWDSIDESNQFISIDKAIVYNEHNEYVIKNPKTTSSQRVLRLPQAIVDALPARGEAIIVLNPDQISHRFVEVVHRLGLPHCTFHSLRHYNASIMLQLNIPDKYAMERTGHATSNMLKTVYQHTFSNEQLLIADRLDEFYATNLLNTKTSGE